MSHNEYDLDIMINKILDEQLGCNDMPYVCGMINTKFGRQRIFNAVKSMILEQGMTDIDAILIQIEDAHDWNE
jgi:predicted metallopeptidase